MLSPRTMRTTLIRTIVNVSKHDGLWSVDDGGQAFGHSPDKEIARAAAHRHARQLVDGGRPCEVRVSGEAPNWRG